MRDPNTDALRAISAIEYDRLDPEDFEDFEDCAGTIEAMKKDADAYFGDRRYNEENDK